jgi:hypothetical protein
MTMLVRLSIPDKKTGIIQTKDMVADSFRNYIRCREKLRKFRERQRRIARININPISP